MLRNFVINTHNDWWFLAELVADIRRCYDKEASILIISDGDKSEEIGWIAEHYNATVVWGDRLKHQRNCLWTKRLYTQVLTHWKDAELYCRIDPDVKLQHKLTLPDEYFDICSNGFIGAVTIEKRRVAEDVLKSPHLNDSFTYTNSMQNLGRLHCHDFLKQAVDKDAQWKRVPLVNSCVRFKYPSQFNSTHEAIHPRIDSIPLVGQRCYRTCSNPELIIYPKRKDLDKLHKQGTENAKGHRSGALRRLCGKT